MSCSRAALRQPDPKERAAALRMPIKISSQDMLVRAGVLAGLGDGDQQEATNSRATRPSGSNIPLGAARLVN